MDEITACKEMSSPEPDKAKAFMVKIFVFTAIGHKQDNDECLAAGTNEYGFKPLNLNRFS